MSEITGAPAKHGVELGVFVDAVEGSLSRAQKVLAGISGGWQKAVGSAISRAAAAGKTEAKSAVTAEYAISQSTFLRSTRNVNHFQRDAEGVSVVFGFAGYVLPLLSFNTSVSSSGAVSTQVKRQGAKETLDRAFRARMGGHTGIYERYGPDRFPVRELFGPATPQMLYSNEDVLDRMEAKMADVYDARIDHEILRLLNGWGA